MKMLFMFLMCKRSVTLGLGEYSGAEDPFIAQAIRDVELSVKMGRACSVKPHIATMCMRSVTLGLGLRGADADGEVGALVCTHYFSWPDVTSFLK